MPQDAQCFIALLRGLNVGGQNVIGKDDLIRCFEDLGFDSVRTYIQSGNVLFRSEESRVATLTGAIEAALSERLANPVRAVVLSRARYRAAVASAPNGWGRRRRPEAQRGVHPPRRHAAAGHRATAPPEGGHRNGHRRTGRYLLVHLEAAPDPDDVDEGGRGPRLPARHRPQPPDGLQAAGASGSAVGRTCRVGRDRSRPRRVPAASDVPAAAKDYNRARCLSARARVTSNQSGRCRTR